MRMKSISLVLVLTMLMSLMALCIPASATTPEPTGGTVTIMPNKASVATAGEEVTYTIALQGPSTAVMAIGFRLTVPDGLSYKADSLAVAGEFETAADPYHTSYTDTSNQFLSLGFGWSEEGSVAPKSVTVEAGKTLKVATLIFTASKAVADTTAGAKAEDPVMNSYTEAQTNSVLPMNHVVKSYTSGVAVKGKVASYNPKNAVTLELQQDNAAKYTTTITALAEGSGPQTQDFAFEGVAAGTYDLVVKKAGHLTYTVTGVVVGESELDLSTMIGKAYSTITMLAGDIDNNGVGDGMINYLDLYDLLGSNNYDMDATGAANASADLDGDGMVNYSDLFVLLNIDYYDHSIVDCTFPFN